MFNLEMKLYDWISIPTNNKTKYWCSLSENQNAISLLEKNQDKINWKYFSKNRSGEKLIILDNFIKGDWFHLSSNPAAIGALLSNRNLIYWLNFSKNDCIDAINILEENPDNIEWYSLSENPSAIKLLEKYPDKINWFLLSSNPNAIPLLEKNQDKLDWVELYKNPSIFKIDKKYMMKKCQLFAKELVSKVFDPIRLQKLAKKNNKSIIEILDDY